MNNGATRTCTCHPDDNPPVPCAKAYALAVCRKVAADNEAQKRFEEDLEVEMRAVRREEAQRQRREEDEESEHAEFDSQTEGVRRW